MRVIHSLKMDLVRPWTGDLLHMVQGDSNTRVVELQLFSDGKEWDIPSADLVTVAFKKPDQTKGFYETSGVIDGNRIQVVLAPQVLTAHGKVTVVVELRNAEGSSLASFPFGIMVAQNPEVDAEASEDYFNYVNPFITEALEKVEAAAAAANGAADRAEGALATAEEAVQEAVQVKETLKQAEAAVVDIVVDATSAVQNANAAVETAEQTIEEVIAAKDSFLETAGNALEEIRNIVTNGVDAPPIVNSNRGEVITLDDSTDRLLRGLKVFGKTEQNGIPTPEAPVPLESVGDSGSVQIQIHPAHKTIENDTLCGIPVTSGGNYTDSTGKQWICDEVDFEKGVYVQRVGKLNVYDSEVKDWGIGSAGHDFFIQMEKYDSDPYVRRYIPALCNSLPYNEDSPIDSFRIATTANSGWQGYARIAFRVPSDINTVDLFKEYVGEDCIVLYQLKEENPIALSAEQLAAFSEKYGANTIAYGTTHQNGIPTPDKPVLLVNTTEVVQSILVSTPNDLPGIPVESGGNYTDETGKQWICDEVDFEKGVYVQRVGTELFDGSADEAWKYESGWIGSQFFIAPQMNASKAKLVINSNFQSRVVTAEDNNAYITPSGNISCFHFAITSLSDWRSYLSSHPMTIVYELAEENHIPLSEDQKATFAALHSNYPNTTVFNDKNAGMEVKYVADTKLYIDRKFNELAAALVSKV